MEDIETVDVDLTIHRAIPTEELADALSDDIIDAVESVKFDDHDLACTFSCPQHTEDGNEGDWTDAIHMVDLIVQSNKLSDGSCINIEQADIDGLSKAFQKIEGHKQHIIRPSKPLTEEEEANVQAFIDLEV